MNAHAVRGESFDLYSLDTLADMYPPSTSDERGPGAALHTETVVWESLAESG